MASKDLAILIASVILGAITSGLTYAGIKLAEWIARRRDGR